MENYESIDKALNISETDIVPTKKVSPPKEVSKINEIEKDYEYTRANLYSIIEKGQEAINGIMEVAGERARSKRRQDHRGYKKGGIRSEGTNLRDDCTN